MAFKDNCKALDEFGKRIILYQYGLARQDRVVLVDIANFKIVYGVSTLPGQSGCPVVQDDAIIAIHVGGDKEEFNIGRVIDISLVNSLIRWI